MKKIIILGMGEDGKAIMHNYRDKNTVREVEPQPMKPQQSKSAESNPVYFELFQHLNEQHNLILLDSEMQEIIRICEKYQPKNIQTAAKEKEFCEALERMKANSFSREEIERLQSSVYEITGKGEVMKLFNSLLGVAAG